MRLWLAVEEATTGAMVLPPQAPAAPSATKVLTISPVDDSGHLMPGYRVVKRQPGAKCTPHSTFTGNAYKCVSHFTYDPCWLTGDPAFVACV